MLDTLCNIEAFMEQEQMKAFVPHGGSLFDLTKGGLRMDNVKFADMRRGLNVTKRELSHLLGVSPRTVRSYEKGVRSVPTHVERQLFSLTSMKQGKGGYKKSYGQINGCSAEQRLSCPAWKLRIGQVSWFMNVSICAGDIDESWSELMTLCRNCEMLQGLL